MKNLIRKGIQYAKQNPEETKRYAKKAYDTIQKHRKKSKAKR